MNVRIKVIAGAATIAAALVLAPKPSHVDESIITNPPLTCYSNESACDLINPTHADIEYVPCVEEDDPTPCYWDAKTRGNGQGQSFINTGREIVYIP